MTRESCFQIATWRVWSALTGSVTDSMSTDAFKEGLKTYAFKQTFNLSGVPFSFFLPEPPRLSDLGICHCYLLIYLYIVVVTVSIILVVFTQVCMFTRAHPHMQTHIYSHNYFRTEIVHQHLQILMGACVGRHICISISISTQVYTHIHADLSQVDLVID